jgi:uncharacterized DUF497 family protein
MQNVIDWDDDKAEVNRRKHRVAFEEAASTFRDQNALTFLDELHSEKEERWYHIGMSSKGRLLLVVYSERNDALRIISSRKANRNEKRIYGQKKF